MRCTTGRSAYSQLAVPEKRKGDSRLGISSSYSYSPGVDVPEWSGSSQIWWLDKSSSFSKSAILLVGDTKRRVLAGDLRYVHVRYLSESRGIEWGKVPHGEEFIPLFWVQGDTPYNHHTFDSQRLHERFAHVRFETDYSRSINLTAVWTFACSCDQ